MFVDVERDGMTIRKNVSKTFERVRDTDRERERERDGHVGRQIRKGVLINKSVVPSKI